MTASMNTFLTSLRVGWLLGRRQIQHANKWTVLLIIAVMTITFLNLVVVSGILVGLIEGGNRANRQEYTSNVLVTKLAENSVIENTQGLIQILDNSPAVGKYSVRYATGATAEANYQTRRDFNGLPNSVPASLVGINIANEQAITDIESSVIEGSFLEPGESGYVVLGATLLERHSAFSDTFEPLRDVYPGDKIKLSITGVDPLTLETIESDASTTQRTQEFIVKGIVDSKVGEVSLRFFISESDFRRFSGRRVLNANEIAIEAAPGVSDDELKDILVRNNFQRYAKVETAAESIPKFLDDMTVAFALLGNVVGGIGLIVASITIFIVIYINAVTRRKQIGIMKAIGVRGMAIRLAYVIQALFYAIIGSGIALILTYGVLVPGFERNPLDFPFSDGILVAPVGDTVTKLIILLIVTTLAGLIPAWIIVKKNTLDSILGRN